MLSPDSSTKNQESRSRRSTKTAPAWEGEFDFIVIGSGAGGAPVAANLALNGFSVALIEAGGTDEPSDYTVPAFHPKACEDSHLSWEFVIRHYQDDAQQDQDSKTIGKTSPEFVRKYGDKFGIFYPRAGTLGGCTTHHALITIYPHKADWERIACETGDDSWRASNMGKYFTEVERCQYCGKRYDEASGHGLAGWLPTNIAKPNLITRDWNVFRIVWATLLSIVEGHLWWSICYFWHAWRQFLGSPVDFLLQSYFDPNDFRTPSFEREGLFFVPFSTEVGRRASVRDFLKSAQNRTDNLTILTDTLVTRVLFDDGQGKGIPLDVKWDSNATKRYPRSLRKEQQLKAIGVEAVKGCYLYKAAALAGPEKPLPPPIFLKARKEVILAGGAFNSPQLLMLSGLGPTHHLKENNIIRLKSMPGVGANLQDRYEVGVVCRTREPFALTRGAKFCTPKVGEEPDPIFKDWMMGRGPYTTNGVIICFTKKSKSARAQDEPDLFVFCVPGDFHGYFPGFSKEAYKYSVFSWLILKAHTRNRGSVRLVSRGDKEPPDPRDPPSILFNYFDTPSSGLDPDLEAVVDAIEFVRHINDGLSDIVYEEVWPGPEIDTREKLRQFVKNEAWGHHASCTNKMGQPQNRETVVDSNFKVVGTDNLRIVDASVFPNIPGYFIVLPTFMIAQKASEVIIDDHKSDVGQNPSIASATYARSS
jgi:choline dehydrogenase-like flavoprotein